MMRGAVILVAQSALAAGVFHGSWDNSCFDGNIQDADGHDMTKSAFVDSLEARIQASAAAVMQSNMDFKLFMDSRGSCQHRCMETVTRSSLSAMVGKLGPYVMNNVSIHLTTEALRGAFMACYPSPPEEQVMRVVTDVVQDAVLNGARAFAAPTAGWVPTTNSCPNEARGYEFPMDEFNTRFETAFRHSIANIHGGSGEQQAVQEFFQMKAKVCQESCLRETVPQAVLTLFQNNRTFNNTLVVHAVTGAVKACFPGAPLGHNAAFPGVPQDTVQKVVSETMQAMTWPAIDQSCFRGTIHGPGGNDFTQGQMLERLDAQVEAAVHNVMESNIAFKMFMETRGNCEHACMASVMRSGMSALFGKFGPELVAQSTDSAAILALESLASGFKACYHAPAFDWGEPVFRVVTAVLRGVGSTATPGPGFRGHAYACPNEARAYEFPVEDVEQDFEVALRRIIPTRPAVAEFIQKRGKTCQVDCLRETVSKTALTLFLNNHEKDEERAVEAYTGAVGACFPGLHESDALRDVVAEAVKVVTRSPAHTTYPPTSDQSCWVGTVPSTDGNDLTNTQVADALNAQVQAAALGLMDTNRSFRLFMNSRGACQHRCMSTLSTSSIRAMLGTMGPDVLSNSSFPLVTTALMGAFKACYPGHQCAIPGRDQVMYSYNSVDREACLPPRENVMDMVQGVLDGPVRAHVDLTPPTHESHLDMDKHCPNELRESEFPMDEFKHQFEMAFLQVVIARPTVQEWFQTRAKECQIDCIRETVPEAAKALFLADDLDIRAVNFLNVTYALESLSGAIQACYPGVPMDALVDVVTETITVFNAAHGDEYFSSGHAGFAQPQTLYDAKVPSSGFSVATFGFAVAMIASFFVVGGAVLLRKRRQALDRGSVEEMREMSILNCEEGSEL